MNIRWKYDGGSGYILILKYEPAMFEGWDFIHMVKHWYDLIISLRREILAHKKSLKIPKG
jgi:hypothetical protein